MTTENSTDNFVIEQMLTYPSLDQTTTWLVPGLIIEAGINYLTAYSGHGKSLLSLDLAHSCTHGRKFLGLFNVPVMNVLYIDQDGNNPRELNKRILDFGFSTNGKLFRMNQQGLRLDRDDHSQWLTKQCLDKGIGLVIFDAMIRFHRSSESDPAAMATIRQNLQALTTAGITVLVIHHNSRKGTFRGGSEIIAMADAFVNLKKPSKSVKRFQLTIEKERTESDIDFNLVTIEPKMIDGITSLVGTTAWEDEDGLDESSDQIVEFCDGLGKTKTEIRAAVGGDVVKIDSAIQRLVGDGRLRVMAVGRSKLYMATEAESEME
jgi:hypothetical protein